VSNQTAGVALRTALFGNDSFRYKEAGKEHPIVLEFAGVYKTQDLFGSVYLSTPKGLVPMTELGAVQETQTSPNIRRINKERITEIDINIGKSTIGPVQKKIQSVLSEINFEAGYSASFGGMSEMQAESTGEIGMAFMLAIILTFMILAAVLNSLAHPFTIATSILFSFAGVFVMLFLTGASINIAALLSFVMLVGLLVSNNILLLEPTIHEMSRGVALKTAMWEQFVSKTRMMLMTTIAVATGLIPQLWSSDGAKVSMAAVIIGGVMASLFWTYFVTPALFVIMEKLRNKK
jgi:HAE1 family hydrophobic/amphiphilic exporter-1